MSEVKVEQVDREAADAITADWPAISKGISYTGLCLALARHRIEATRALSAEVEALRAALPDEIDLYRTIKAASDKSHIGIARHIIATHWPLLNKEPAR